MAMVVKMSWQRMRHEEWDGRADEEQAAFAFFTTSLPRSSVAKHPLGCSLSGEQQKERQQEEICSSLGLFLLAAASADDLPRRRDE